MMANGMRGLSNFIAELRACANKEAEKKRVDKELAHVRERFLKDTHMTGYDRKKYVSKLLYITMIGYGFDFGHMEAVSLLTSTKYSEKQIGYLAVALLLNEEHELTPLIINSVLKDLVSKNELWMCLALATVANIGGREMAETLHQTIEELLSAVRQPTIRKRALLATLRLFRKHPDIMDPGSWQDKVIAMLEERDIGIVMAACSLLIALVKANGTSEYMPAVPRLIKVMSRVVVHRLPTKEWDYHFVPAPWLQVRALRLLQMFPPVDDPAQLGFLREVLGRILSTTEMTKSSNRNNATYSILFEAINVIVHLGERDLMKQAAALLGKFITAREPNIKYLGLESFAKLVSQLDDPAEVVDRHERTIFECLRHQDISIRREALNMIFNMCDRRNSQQIVGELLDYLPVSEFEIREELVIKIAILAEKFAQDLSWYINIALTLVSQGGEFVAEDVWWRVAQIVTNNKELHSYAARTCFEALQPVSAPETMVKLAAYILGEFGGEIEGVDGMNALAQIGLLHSRFATASNTTKAILLTAYGKIGRRSASARPRVLELLHQNADFIYIEAQQRAVEMTELLQHASGNVVSKVLAQLPDFPERESSLERMIRARQQGSTPAAARADENADAQQAEEPAVELSAPPAAPSGGRQQQQQQQSSGGDMLQDLMGDIAAAPSHGGSVPAAAAVSIDDLLGGGPAPAAAPAASGSGFGGGVLGDLGGILAVGAAVNQAEVDRLLVSDNGPLYEDNYLAIMLRGETRGNKMRILLQFQNKTMQPIGDLRSLVQSTSAVTVQASAVQPMLMPGQAVQQTLMIDCVSCFKEAPSLALSYFAGVTVNMQLRLPIAITKFLEPQTQSSADFFRIWGQIAPGSPQETVAIFQHPRPLDPAVFGRVLQGYRLAVLEGVDSNPNNLVGAAVLHTSTGHTPVQLRLELAMAQQKLRLTVRTPSPDVTATLSRILQTALEK